MSTSNPLSNFLTTGQRPSTTKATSALLDQLRNEILTTTNEIMKPPSATTEAIITASMTKDYMTWKRSNPSGTAQQFIAAKTAPKPSATTAAFAVGIDPKNLPKLDNNMIDALAVTNAQNRAKAAELAAASASVSARRAPGRIVINKSKYSQP